MLTVPGRFITVKSEQHTETKSFIWSDDLPIELAAREAAAAFGFEVQKLEPCMTSGWTFRQRGVVLDGSRSLGEMVRGTAVVTLQEERRVRVQQGEAR